MKTNNKKPTSGGNHLAGIEDMKANERIVVDQTAENKAFQNLKARLALHGFQLYRTDPRDGFVVYLSERMGMFQLLPSIEAVADYAAALETIKQRGGR